MFKRLSVFMITVTILIVNLNVFAEDEKSTANIAYAPNNPYDLPGIIMACDMYYRWYVGGFRCLESEPPHNPVMILVKNIEKLKLGGDMSWCDMMFTVQNIPRNRAGFVRIKNKTLEESGVPFAPILFVTTPIESFNNRVICVLSVVGPEATEIFAVDNKLNVEMLYDGVEYGIKNLEEMHVYPFIGSIYGIETQKPGFFLLQERSRYNYAGPHENRTFTIDVTKGVFELKPKYAPMPHG